MVSGDAVSQNRQHPGAFDIFYRRRLGRHAIEIRSLADVGRIRLPLISIAGRELEVLPVLITIRNSCIFLAEDLRIDRRRDGAVHFFLGGPDILQVHRLALFVSLPIGSAVEIMIDVAHQRVSHHQRRRHEVVGPHFRIDTALEVSIAAQHRHRDQTMVINGFGNVCRQRAGVADAGSAAIADHLKAQLIQSARAVLPSCSNPSPRASPAPAKS